MSIPMPSATGLLLHMPLSTVVSTCIVPRGFNMDGNQGPLDCGSYTGPTVD